ncbi:MAG: D-alanyl-D-alanine carboxypeptidase/D-alanyl-D-alanine-endopeptidase [Gemmatimonadota bacterium]|nr:D-alanyl-D-alanine carboxypeptidase/D-alanyl-D-alanine-endopeptidase [Gemmatimonadota bacterium]
MSFLVLPPRARRVRCATPVALALSVLLLPATAGAQALPARIQAVLDRPEFRHASWALEFYDLRDRRVVFGVNNDRLMVPGSTTKLLTMGTALEVLGPDHRFTTRVYRTGPVRDGILDGDLVLVASGDPNLSGRARPDGTYAFIDHDHSYGGPPLDTDPLTVLRDLARQVAGHGIRAITGQVIVDASLFPEGERDGGTGVTMGPLVINDNVIDIVVTPAATAGMPARVEVTPRTSYLTVRAHVLTSDSGQAQRFDAREDSTDRSHRVLVATGSVPVGSAAQNLRWVVPEPGRFGEVVLAEALEDVDVAALPRLASRTVDFAALADAYVDSLVVAEHVSLPLIEEAVVVLKTSQNLHASNFPLLLASLPEARDQARTGFDLEHDWLERAGLDLDGAAQGDGAGARAHFSPAFMTRFLGLVASRPWADGFRAALPVLGRDGTLADIQVDAPGAGHVQAKTGTYGIFDPLNRRLLITGKGLAGYLTTRGGREIAFAIYVNNFATDQPDPAVIAGQALGEIASLAWEEIP